MLVITVPIIRELRHAALARAPAPEEQVQGLRRVRHLRAPAPEKYEQGLQKIADMRAPALGASAKRVRSKFVRRLIHPSRSDWRSSRHAHDFRITRHAHDFRINFTSDHATFSAKTTNAPPVRCREIATYISSQIIKFFFTAFTSLAEQV